MFSSVVARVTVRCQLVSQQKERGIISDSLRLLLVNITGNGKTRAAFHNTGQIVNNAPAETMSSDEKKPFRRLPLCARPYHYDISLTPDLTTFTFDGIENVHLNVSSLLAVVPIIARRLCFSQRPVSRKLRSRDRVDSISACISCPPCFLVVS